MRHILFLIVLCVFGVTAQAQHTFQNTSLSEALIELDKSSKHYSISIVYDELEDFTVSKTIKRGRSLPDAVREVCGFYPIRVTTKGNEIFVECMQKDRTKFSGRLIGPDRQPIAYANIVLYNCSDSVIMDGGVSNEAGDFVIPCSAAQACVRISCVGFKTIEQQMAIGNVGTIRMQAENYHVGNVNVSGRMPAIRSEADRLQYIVSNDEFAKGHNVLELLSRVPMVSMAGGQAMILGKGPANFMLNGRVSEMGHEAIQQKLWTIRAEDIERIEVISVPTGRYQTDTGGGYINIVLHRDQTLGWRGDISAQTGMSDDWSGQASGSLYYASEKFDLSADMNGGQTTQTTDNLTTYRFDASDITSDTRTKQKEKEMAANLTLRYLPTKNLELGTTLTWQTLWPEKVIDGVISRTVGPILSEAEQMPADNTTTKSLTAYCDWQFGTKGEQLSFTYQDYKKDDDTESAVWSDDMTATRPHTFFFEDYITNVDYHIQSARIDLTLPTKVTTIDAGVSYTSIRNQAIIRKTVEGAYSPTMYEGKDFDYQEKTKAAYLSIHRDWTSFAFKAGLRYEHCGKAFWLPSFGLSFKPEEGKFINLSWAVSCIRPNFYDLNPHRIYKTGHEYSEGNPLLKPSRTSHLELSYHNHKGLDICAYHHHVSNMIQPLTKIVQSGFTSYTTFQEMGRCNQTGLYLRYQYRFTPHLMATAEGNVYYHDFDAIDDYTSSLWKLHGWGKLLSVSLDWYLNSQHSLLLNTRYQHWFSDYVGLTKTDGYGYFNFALRYSMLSDRLKLSLVVNDPFGQHVTDEMTNILSHINHHARYIGLSASYSLGGKDVRHVRHDTKDTESQRAQKR